MNEIHLNKYPQYYDCIRHYQKKTIKERKKFILNTALRYICIDKICVY